MQSYPTYLSFSSLNIFRLFLYSFKFAANSFNLQQSINLYESHLQKFMDFLGYNYKMRHQHLETGDLCRISFDNKHMVEVLNSYGCITYANIDHSSIEISIVGTKSFLDGCVNCFNCGYLLKISLCLQRN